jgi:hypothetical protein
MKKNHILALALLIFFIGTPLFAAITSSSIGVGYEEGDECPCGYDEDGECEPCE